MATNDVGVLLFGGRRTPRALRGLPSISVDQATDFRRLVVVGADKDLAAVLKQLLRADRLDIEVAQVRRPWTARRALSGSATRVPLIRDETGSVIVGAAVWVGENSALTGEAVVDDTVLFDGEVTAVRVEPIPDQPGLRATVLTRHMRPGRWVTGRAAQLGTPGALVMRDGELGTRPVKRSTFYRHTQGWLAVR
ncbi:peptidase M50 [Mycolicibacterium bacteremicum]|uniref:Peptidase M50 n=1 Tax=Mycolicibacterium bacteremicum TaxID=564198 RepID=A0A1W9YNN9_MYCBA|nr:peptidase M50 [Mycolicibacterium bacteremicum]MCV7432237.1 peptidase M50 [Mycolicibacterium bacteremicum]ORA01663.1 peptidase M50 [Mycolicibacterium bacteremicum]